MHDHRKSKPICLAAATDAPQQADPHVGDVIVGAPCLTLPKVDGAEQHGQHYAVHNAGRVV
jgi:hypothetical protein